MIKFPLKKEILLITEAGDFVCQIDYAGNDTLICHNVYKRIYESDGDFSDNFISGEIVLEREKACAYSYIADDNEDKSRENYKQNKTINKKSKVIYLNKEENKCQMTTERS